MRKIPQVLTILALSTASYALGQLSLSIQRGTPEQPVVGLPFSADQTVRTVQKLNGIALTGQATGHIYRSSDVVERIEGTDLSTNTNPAHPGPDTGIYIIDRTKHIAIELNSRLKTATVTHFPVNSIVAVSLLSKRGTTPPFRQIKPENLQVTDLGGRTQDMMPLVGKRTTGTFPANTIGNDQPLKVATETWIAPQLKLVVKDIEQNPMIGERTIELTNIRSREPDPKLFEVPDGYTLKESPRTIGVGPPPQSH